MAVIFPDVELWACGAIRAALAPFYSPVPYVGVDVPSTRPALFVTVRRDGGPVQDFVIERPRLSVNCWGSSEKDVTDLARRVSAVFRDSTGGGVTAVRQIGGPSPIADAQPRRLLTFQLTVKGSNL